METLENKDELAQRENVGLGVSGLESLTSLCPFPACVIWTRSLHLFQPRSSPLQGEDAGLDDFKVPSMDSES